MSAIAPTSDMLSHCGNQRFAPEGDIWDASGRPFGSAGFGAELPLKLLLPLVGIGSMSILHLELPVETALLGSLGQLDQAILDALPVGVYACDATGQIVRVNERAIELWGRKPRLLDPAQRFCGSFRVETLEGELIPHDKTPMARAVLAGERFDGVEAVVQNPDGTRWIARVNVAPLFDVDGVRIGAINCFQDVTREHDMRSALERQQRTFDLAMVASQMGTWRYTLADKVCIYDPNAQRLYGLTEARFLHDEDGVKAKFHPDDMERMWAAVATALDPGGDGRYEVEYRVKQLDGSWRWLSAWGVVEFEGHGPGRKPIAISGASRDLTERKCAEDLQRMLVNEINHRAKNTLATVQAIVRLTLRDTVDPELARDAIDARLIALAGAHDLLTMRSWSGADLTDVVARAMTPFSAGQIACDGPSVELTPSQALALSLALHELATNAAKYGALSRPDGRVELRWTVGNGKLNLNWLESGGPKVIAPSRRGFGSRLLEDILFRDLDGESRVDFLPEGVRCAITATLKSEIEGKASPTSAPASDCDRHRGSPRNLIR